jgi:DNA helicase-2/ATP-dependent DNA helicase PcrA
LDQVQWNLEENRLQKVYNKILEELARRGKEVKDYRKTVRQTGRTIWEEADHTWEYGDIDAAVEIKQYMDSLRQVNQNYEIAQRQFTKLERLELSPYFGRIDFVEKGFSDTEEVYIGISSFFDEDGNILIYDWRAPISGIFYDFELGPAHYLCPEGLIEGEVSLKRQFRISQNRLELMLDTGINIGDEILQNILSSNADEKMHNIVTTIQKEQNQIIRDENHQLLMVQGVAGSGKTSIALHRIAYLLYQNRDSNMTAGNILIFSPNTVFNDYISNVLPELGEENMQQTTFEEYLARAVEKELNFESAANHMEYVLVAQNLKSQENRIKGIAYKSSMDFYHLLNDYVGYLEENAVYIKDISIEERIYRSPKESSGKKRVLISKNYIKKMYDVDYAGLPLAKRLEKLKQRLYYLIRTPWQERRQQLEKQLSENPNFRGKVRAYSRLFVYLEFKPVREQIEAMLQFDSYQAFLSLFKDTRLFAQLAGKNLPDNYEEICMYTARQLQDKYLGYEDISAYSYLKGELAGTPSMSHIRHVVADEAQDYTPVQYGILKQLFSQTRMTLLGDFNQAIHPLRDEFGYEQVAQILSPGSKAVLRLTKGYRSTAEIVDFSRHILKGSYIESIQRSGEKPQVILESDPDVLVEKLISDVQLTVREGLGSIGIICRTARESQSLYDRINSKMNASLLTKDDINFNRGVIILPVYLAKGLEFDAAMLFGADRENYGHEGDRKLFYTACTRALHKLHLYSSGDISPFIKEIPEELYQLG